MKYLLIALPILFIISVIYTAIRRSIIQGDNALKKYEQEKAEMEKGMSLEELKKLHEAEEQAKKDDDEW